MGITNVIALKGILAGQTVTASST